jgi:hypothetical protein
MRRGRADNDAKVKQQGLLGMMQGRRYDIGLVWARYYGKMRIDLQVIYENAEGKGG